MLNIELWCQQTHTESCSAVQLILSLHWRCENLSFYVGSNKNTTGCYYRNRINSRCKRYSLPHPLWFPHRGWVNRAMNCASVVLAALYWADSKIYNDSWRSRSRGFSLKTCCTTCIYTWAPCKVLDQPTFFIIYLHTSYYFRGKSERFEEDEVLQIIRTQVCTERNSMLQK